jgi:hypothetical protein
MYDELIQSNYGDVFKLNRSIFYHFLFKLLHLFTLLLLDIIILRLF